MMQVKCYVFVLCVLGLVTTQATLRNQIYKPITIQLPYSPDHVAIPASLDMVSSMFLASASPGAQHSTLTKITVMNNQNTQVPSPFGYCPEKLILNNVPDQENPLYDKPIKLLAAFNKVPIAVVEGVPAIMVIDTLQTTSHQTMVMTPPLCDAYQKEVQEIVALSTGFTGTDDLILNAYIFAGVKSVTPDGIADYGVALIQYDSVSTQEKITDSFGKEREITKKTYFLNVCDAVTGVDHGNRAASLNTVLGTDGSMTIVEIVALCWNPHVERLYTVVRYDDTVLQHSFLGVVVGRVDLQRCLQFEYCYTLPDSVDVEALCKVVPFQTSTGLSYIIVRAGAGNAVRAFALADRSLEKNRLGTVEDHLHGMFASKTAQPRYRYMSSHAGIKVIGCACNALAERAVDNQGSDDCAVRVGGDAVLPNTITDTIVVEDAVFVTVACEGMGQYPGIFHSRVLLDAQGKIAGWTAWQRIGGIQEGVRTALINPTNCFFAYLKAASPELVCHITFNVPPLKSVDEQFDTPVGDLTDLIDECMPHATGGVHGLFDFPSALLGSTTHDTTSMLAVTGHKKILLVETGSNDEYDLYKAYTDGFTSDIVRVPASGVPAGLACENMPGRAPRVLECTGGVFEQLGPLTSATVVTDGVYHWFVVAGLRGIAILAHDDGSGWKSDRGLGRGFSNLGVGLSFKMLGDYRYVKKVVGDTNGTLYILTHSTLERVALNQHAIKHNIINNVMLARASEWNATFFDVGISGPLALIATSQGLWCNGQGTTIERNTLHDLKWRTITIPGALCPVVYKLFFVSATGHEYGFAHQAQLYACVGSLHQNATSIYRLYIRNVMQEGVTDSSVELLSDTIFFNKSSPLFFFNTFKDFFVTNGVHYLHARSGELSERPSLQAIRLSHMRDRTVAGTAPYEIPLQLRKSAKTITALVQNSATGNWLIGGDFGLRIHN